MLKVWYIVHYYIDALRIYRYFYE